MNEILTDPIALTQALVRCPSVTPHEGGALQVLESVLMPAGFRCHRLTMTEPGTPDVDNLYARIGIARQTYALPGIRTLSRPAMTRPGPIRRSQA